jgi:DNA-binding NtrC family response regulator
MDAKASILIVDDEVGMCETLLDILAEMGYHTVIAADGHEAIQKAKENAFDVIFMDIRMPGINGVDALKEIKRLHPETAVVLMTAYAIDDRIREAQRVGAYSVLDKPLDVETIISLIEGMRKGA